MIPVAEVIQLLGIHSRVKWYKRLEQHGIQVVEYENQDCLAAEDVQALQKRQQAYKPFADVIEEQNLVLTVAERAKTVKFLERIGLAVRSETLPFTDQIRVKFVSKPYQKAVKAIELYGSLWGPETEQAVTVQQLAERLRIQPDDIACDLYHGRVADSHITYIEDFLYFRVEYADQCDDYHKTRVSLNVLLSDKPYPAEQIMRKIQETYTCGWFDQYYIGSEPGWYGLRKEWKRVQKVIDECVESLALEQGDFPKTVIDGVECMEADLCVKQLCQNPVFSLESEKINRTWQDFLYRNATQLELRQQNEVLYLPVKRTEVQNAILTLFFEFYGLSDEEIHAKMTEKLKERMPVALSLLQEKNTRLTIQNGMMVQLFLYAKHDLPDFTQSELDRVTKAFETVPLVDGACFSWMVEQVYQRYQCKFRKLPKFKQSVRSVIPKIKEAYTVEQYAAMAYCLFHPDYIAQQNVREKACDNAMMAEAWLYLSLHWICALRQSDLQKIPILSLPGDAEMLLQQIKTNSLPDAVYEEILDRLAFQIQMHPWKPQKTHQYNVPNVKLFFPQSLKAHFGMLYLLVLVHRELEHRQDKKLFRLPHTDLLLKFLGKTFVDQLDKGRFSSRAANKAFLQGIQQNTDQHPGIRITGYMMASLARSHKGKGQELATVTEVYLRDAKFTGQSAEYFAKMMFDRGVLSFVPDLMLKIVYGSAYEGLPLDDQTQLIQSIGIVPSQIEGLLMTSVQAMQQARTDVMRLLKMQSQHQIMEGLIQISQGQAASKGDHSYCLRRALGQKCDHVTCIGCPYELQTRTGIYMLTQQYRHMMGQYRKVNQTGKAREAARYRRMIERVIPVLAGAATYLQRYDPNSWLLDWMTEVIKSC